MLPKLTADALALSRTPVGRAQPLAAHDHALRSGEYFPRLRFHGRVTVPAANERLAEQQEFETARHRQLGDLTDAQVQSVHQELQDLELLIKRLRGGK